MERQPIEREVPLPITDDRFDESIAEVIEQLRMRLYAVKDVLEALPLPKQPPPS